MDVSRLTPHEWAEKHLRMKGQDDLDRMGLSPRCGDNAIVSKYRELSRLYHPDRHQAHKELVTKIFQLIGEAKERLLSRSIYDRVHLQQGPSFSLHSEPVFFGTIIEEFQKQQAQIKKEGEAKLKELQRQRETQQKEAAERFGAIDKEREEMLARLRHQEQGLHAAFQQERDEIGTLEKQLEEQRKRLASLCQQ